MAEIIQLMKQPDPRETRPHSKRCWVEPGYVFLVDNYALRLDADRVDNQYQFNLIGFFGQDKVTRTLPMQGYADLSAYSSRMVRLLAVEWRGETPQRCFVETVNVDHFLKARFI